jgi:hypothetical protein
MVTVQLTHNDAGSCVTVAPSAHGTMPLGSVPLGMVPAGAG